MTRPILEARGLTKYFGIKQGLFLHPKLAWVKAVDGVDFTVHLGETLGLIGESGLRQDDHCQARLAARNPHRGYGEVRSSRHLQPGR